ncbi:hypothetical protein KFE25_006728 [Diacronema lutheri]|uniref:Dolichol kinase n=1 Tax=Diacronema lutheri TaxID=2081491 RepID=A0A8J6CE12_DIALT|nr:hypothetical protein KFE25_006728 [Diacronema lutheri]
MTLVVLIVLSLQLGSLAGMPLAAPRASMTVRPLLTARALAQTTWRPARPAACRACATSMSTDDGIALPRVRATYVASAAATTVAWSLCALRALTVHPLIALPPVHNVLTAAGALSALPIFLATFAALAAASDAGWKRLSSQTYRRLNLGLAAASVWCAAAAVGAAGLSGGRTTYPPSLLAGALVAHGATAAHCVRVWSRSLSGRPPTLLRIVRGVLGSLWRLAPTACSDDPDEDRAADGRNEFATLTLGFLAGAALSVFAPFPLATVPSFLGRRLSRAYGAWLLLAAVSMFCCKDAAERGRLNASTFRMLSGGVAASASFHIAITVAKLACDDMALYANAIAVTPASVASLLAYALALGTCTSRR